MPQPQTMSEERKLCKYCKYFVSLYEYRKHNGMHEVCENESTPLQSDWEAEFEALWNDNFVTGGLARFIQQREEIKTFIRNLYTSKVQEAEKLSIYCEHDRDCIRSQLHPTKNEHLPCKSSDCTVCHSWPTTTPSPEPEHEHQPCYCAGRRECHICDVPMPEHTTTSPEERNMIDELMKPKEDVSRHIDETIASALKPQAHDWQKRFDEKFPNKWIPELDQERIAIKSFISDLLVEEKRKAENKGNRRGQIAIMEAWGVWCDECKAKVRPDPKHTHITHNI